MVRVFPFFLSILISLLADAAMSIVSVIICVQRSSIFLFPFKGGDENVSRASFFFSLSLSLSRLCSVSFSSSSPSSSPSSPIFVCSHRPPVLYAVEKNTKMVPLLLLL
jgi:hypothetical protein